MQLTQWKFTPRHQPHPTPVIFDLKPLSLGVLYELQRSMGDVGIPTFEGTAQAFRYSVVGWEGATLLEEPLGYSSEAKREVLDSTADRDWLVWLTEIAGELYARALLKDDERKNS